MNDTAIELQDVDVVYRVRGRDLPVLRSLSLTIGRGESYGLVGESGCGKTTAAFTIMHHLPRNGRVVSGSISVNGNDLLRLGGAEVRRLRATDLSMVYQNPAAALNPSIRVGPQVAEYVIERLRAGNQTYAQVRLKQLGDAGELPATWQSRPLGGQRAGHHQIATLVPMVLILLTIAGAFTQVVSAQPGSSGQIAVHDWVQRPARHARPVLQSSSTPQWSPIQPGEWGRQTFAVAVPLKRVATCGVM